jgi:hypothetical protein
MNSNARTAISGDAARRLIAILRDADPALQKTGRPTAAPAACGGQCTAGSCPKQVEARRFRVQRTARASSD